MAKATNNITQFTDKYQKSGTIGQTLLRRFFKCIQYMLPTEGISSVAEIGCGAGHSTEVLKNFFSNDVSFFASDVDPELVSLAQQRNPEVTVASESIYSLQHPDNAFDIVFCLEVLEHLDDPRKALKELSRVTKHYAVISVPHEPIWRMLNMLRGSYWKHLGNTPGHINHWSRKSFSRFVSSEFEVLKVKNSLPWTIILAKKK
jgi:ubiquinone/menaquinone biosynthesis C-methylase UbiE